MEPRKPALTNVAATDELFISSVELMKFPEYSQYNLYNFQIAEDV